MNAAEKIAQGAIQRPRMTIHHLDYDEELTFASAGEKVEWMYKKGLITESEKNEAMTIIKNEENKSNA